MPIPCMSGSMLQYVTLLNLAFIWRQTECRFKQNACIEPRICETIRETFRAEGLNKSNCKSINLEIKRLNLTYLNRRWLPQLFLEASSSRPRAEINWPSCKILTSCQNVMCQMVQPIRDRVLRHLGSHVVGGNAHPLGTATAPDAINLCMKEACCMGKGERTTERNSKLRNSTNRDTQLFGNLSWLRERKCKAPARVGKKKLEGTVRSDLLLIL